MFSVKVLVDDDDDDDIDCGAYDSSGLLRHAKAIKFHSSKYIESYILFGLMRVQLA